MRAETAPLIAALSRPRPQGLRLVEGRLGGARVAVLTCGVGFVKARQRTAATLARWPAQVVLNLGTCGALVPELSVGDVVHGDRIMLASDNQGGPADTRLSPLGQPRGTVVTVADPVFDPARRAALAKMGGVVCEMEAAGVLLACTDAGVPLRVIKVVSDLAGGGTGDPRPRPGPLDVARFKAQALRLVQQGLAPLLPGLLPDLLRTVG